MKKFAVFSGFLGSGKTTSMMALTGYYSAHHAPAAMISNDLGNGVELADDRLARFSGCRASAVTGECICFCHDVLTARLDAFFDAGCELVLSDIPGFGVGALEHVYHGLTRACPGRYELAPFTVLTEHRNLELLRRGAGDRAHILNAQFMEADLIVLNKCDLLSADEIAADRQWLEEHYPQARVLPLSALRGDGLAELSLALRDGCASLRRPAIDYDGKALQDELNSFSEYYLQYHARVCCNDFDGNSYLAELAGQVSSGIGGAGCDIPHLKLLAWVPEGDYCKADLLGTDRGAAFSRRFSRRCTELAVILNASASCPRRDLDRIITSSVAAVSDRYQLELLIFKKDCLNLGED